MTAQRQPAARSKAQTEPPLDQNQIVQAALDLLDEAGFDGLTMRRLAQKLGIKAASLYWHVRDKQDLLGLLVEEICAGFREVDFALPWREQLDALAHEYRRILRSRRDAPQVFARSGAPAGPNQMRLTETVLKTLLDAGFTPKDAAYAGFLMVDYVTAFVSEEAADRTAENPSSGDQNWLAGLPPAEYPSLSALADHLNQPDAGARFQFGIDVIRSGLEARLPTGH